MAAAGFYAIGVIEPERRAFVEPDGVEHTYGELLAAVNRHSHGLSELGLHLGDTLAVMAGNRLETLEVFAAGIQLGLDLVLVNWHLTAPEVAYILENAGARAVVVDPTHADVVAAAADTAGIEIDRRFAMGPAEGFADLATLADGMPATAPADRHAGQALFYTSGTTGRPKAVRKKLGDLPPELISLSAAIGLRRQPGAVVDTSGSLPPPEEAEVHLLPGPLYHAAPLANACMSLDDGATLVLMERFDPSRFLELVARHRVTNVAMVPIMFQRLLALPDEARRSADVSSLRSVTHAGAPCAVDTKRRMIEWFGPVITESYSSTEGAGTSITSEEWLAKPGSVGRPSAGVTIRILDDDGNECPPGTEGRVFLTQAYWEFEYEGDPDKTTASRHDGLFTVGDIGYIDEDGYLFLRDRDSEIINSGGVNIYPAEVEGVLLEHPAVADGVVIGVPDDEWGEAVRAVVELGPGQGRDDATEADIVAYCRERLAHYKAPKAVDFVDSIGRDLNGKVRKQLIRNRYWTDRDRSI